jgi:hypothetical protein
VVDFAMPIAMARSACVTLATWRMDRERAISPACPSSRGSAAVVSGPASGPGYAGRCSTRSPGQLADQRRHVLVRLQPWLCPGKARPRQPGQLVPFPQRQPGAYPDGSGRL